MPRRGGGVDVAAVKTKGRGKNPNEYVSHLLRRSFCEGGKVKHETLGNLSHLPEPIIEAIRKMLAGMTLVDLDEQFQITRSLPHGHVDAVLRLARELDVERLGSRERCRERDLSVAMICQLVIGAGSKLSMTRRFSQTTLGEELSLGEVGERDVFAALDWLGERQDRIERTLARRHLSGGGFVLYDLSSSCVEGRCCPLAEFGHNRDGKRGSGRSLGAGVQPRGAAGRDPGPPGKHERSGHDPGVLDAVRERFGIDRVILVGDRAMITQAHAQTLKEQGEGFVSAVKNLQIKGLVNDGHLQLSLFDQTNLAEITSPRFPDERLVVCRNPLL